MSFRHTSETPTAFRYQPNLGTRSVGSMLRSNVGTQRHRWLCGGWSVTPQPADSTKRTETSVAYWGCAKNPNLPRLHRLQQIEFGRKSQRRNPPTADKSVVVLMTSSGLRRCSARGQCRTDLTQSERAEENSTEVPDRTNRERSHARRRRTPLRAAAGRAGTYLVIRYIMSRKP